MASPARQSLFIRLNTRAPAHHYCNPQKHGLQQITHPWHRTSSSPSEPQVASHQPPHQKPLTSSRWVLSCLYGSVRRNWWVIWGSVMLPRVGQVLLVVVSCVCESRCLYRHSNSSVSQSFGWEGGVGEQRAGQERGTILKGYPLSATLAKGITPCCRLFSISGYNVGTLFL